MSLGIYASMKQNNSTPFESFDSLQSFEPRAAGSAASIGLSKLTHNPCIDITLLRQLNKKTLMAMCENDAYVLNLCNDDAILYKIMTAADV